MANKKAPANMRSRLSEPSPEQKTFAAVAPSVFPYCKKVLVIGAGAAGMLAAITAAENGANVTLMEKNARVGRKIMITGKGRCNITNNCDVQTFIRNVPVNGRFLYSAASRFSPADTMQFFENLGLALKTERGNRVFPVSERAVDVVDTLRDAAIAGGVQLIHDIARALILENQTVIGVKGEIESYFADSVVICCGGKSYPLTGSTGDGYRLAKQAGHTVTVLKPSLVPLESSDGECKSMQGLALKNVSLAIINNNSKKEIYSDFGEMLFTHFGISGPMVLSASSHIRDFDGDTFTAVVDLKPALHMEQLDRRLQNEFRANANKDISNSFSKLLPKKMIIPVLKRWGIPFQKKCNAVTREERHALCEILKGFTIPITGFRPIEEAIVTSGGVKTDEINPKTMASKRISGLFFAGEVIDCDAYTGGFNLQIAWSTGRLAGENASLSE